MKKMILTIILLITCFCLHAPNITIAYIIMPRDITDPYEDLYEAVKTVESSGKADIINHAEGAYGCVQIRQVKLNEYNRKTGSSVKLRDCLDEKTSRRIFMWHCMQYDNLVLAAKKWNGSGPMTEIYWAKVKKHLKTTNI